MLRHVWDNDGCCIHCGYDGAEASHLNKLAKRGNSHEDIYCRQGTVENIAGLEQLAADKRAEEEEEEDNWPMDMPDDDWIMDSADYYQHAGEQL